MLQAIIRFSLHHRLAVVFCSILLAILGVVAVKNIALDALPDLSDTQVIVRATYMGQTPQQIENQVTLPLTRSLMSIPRTKAIRGVSMLGDAYVYVVFEEGVEYGWARTKVLEYLNQATKQLPQGVSTLIGPEASGVSWIYQYALVDETGQHNLAALRALQDWQLKYALQGVAGVAEVASVGGMVKQYQVIVDPDKQRSLGMTLAVIEQAIQQGNQESSGSVIELAEAEYAIHASGYIQNLHELGNISLRQTENNAPILLKDVARLQFGGQVRNGVADLDGKGEVTGGIVIMQANQNPLTVIQAVKAKLEQLQHTLPKGVKIVSTYDRSALITRAVAELKSKLWQESIIIALVCLVFLWHTRSALVAIVSLPLGILCAFSVMYWQGITINIMSLGGIAIAVGAMVDAAIVMIENLHKHLHRWQQIHTRTATGNEHWQLVYTAAAEVGPTLFYCLLIITVSFLPVLLLEAQEGKLFSPLAYTKTYAMAAASGLALTLVPVLMGYLIRGRVNNEQRNPLIVAIASLYQPALQWVIQRPKELLLICLGLSVLSMYPWLSTGKEFMPALDEGDLLYMPTTLPSLSVGKASELLRQTDALIKTVPEVERVFGKAGRAETATDPAPLSMFETTIQLKPKSLWRSGVELPDIIQELDETVRIPGLTNAWVQPIKTRIDMLATGIRTPLGIKITGNDLAELDKLGKQIEQALKTLPATRSVFADRASDGRFIEITPQRESLATLGVSLSDVHEVVRLAIGGETISEAIEGRTRFPINMRYPQYTRDSLLKLSELPIVTMSGKTIPLSRVATVEVVSAPAMIKSENAELANWVMINLQDTNYAEYIQDAQQVLNAKIKLPQGYQLSWVGEYEGMERVSRQLQLIVPLMLLFITALLWLIFKDLTLVGLILTCLPLSLIGGIWYVWLLDFQFSVATTIGFIALAGVATEFSVIMLLYLQHSFEMHQPTSREQLWQAVMEGALTRLRPKLMTVAVIVAGLWMIMLGEGSGMDIMQRIAAPMLGGMVTAPLLSMFVIPCGYYFLKLRKVAYCVNI